MRLLKSEITQETSEHGYTKATFLQRLELAQFDSAVFYEVDNFLHTLKRFYANRYNEASNKKEKIVEGFNQNEESKALYEHLRSEFQNESVSVLVKNTAEPNRIIEENGKLIQKVYPIYMDPAHPESLFDFREQFFVPQKHFLGLYFDTLHFNLYVIWSMSIVLMITLYFDVLRKMVVGLENLKLPKT